MTPLTFHTTMVSRPTTLALIALHRLIVILGIVALPVAMLAHRAGVPIPLHRVLDGVRPDQEQNVGD